MLIKGKQEIFKDTVKLSYLDPGVLLEPKKKGGRLNQSWTYFVGKLTRFTNTLCVTAIASNTIHPGLAWNIFYLYPRRSLPGQRTSSYGTKELKKIFWTSFKSFQIFTLPCSFIGIELLQYNFYTTCPGLLFVIFS